MDIKRFWSVLLGALVVLLLTLLIAPTIGPSHISLSRAFEGLSPDHEIFFYARLPRVLMSMLSGAALAVAGVLFQALLRDALATPYTLGISSGASLGAVIAISFGVNQVFHLPAIWVCGFAGAAITLILVMAIASEGKRISSFTLLLTGVTINSICLALILFLQNATTFGRSLTIMRWLMGGIEAEDSGVLIWVAIIVIPTVLVIFWHWRDWNLLAIGDEWAATRGVSIRKAMLIGFFAGSLLTGTVTAFTGPIGFVGLIVPHALRIHMGSDHRLLLPASALLGAAFLVICDTVARTATAPTEIPVGVITAMLGGPFFIWLLRSKRRSLWL